MKKKVFNVLAIVAIAATLFLNVNVVLNGKATSYLNIGDINKVLATDFSCTTDASGNVHCVNMDSGSGSDPDPNPSDSGSGTGTDTGTGTGTGGPTVLAELSVSDRLAGKTTTTTIYEQSTFAATVGIYGKEKIGASINWSTSGPKGILTNCKDWGVYCGVSQATWQAI